VDSGTYLPLTGSALADAKPQMEALESFNGKESVSKFRGSKVIVAKCARTGETRRMRLPFNSCDDLPPGMDLLTPRTWAEAGHRYVWDKKGPRIEFKDGQVIWLTDDSRMVYADDGAGAGAAPAHVAQAQPAQPQKKKKKQRQRSGKTAAKNGL